MRGFIRALWGQVQNHRDGKIAKEIEALEEKDWFTVYVFGKENRDWLNSIGYKTILVDDYVNRWDLETQMYRHKLEVFNRATEDFDEFVFLDWDCVPIANLSDAWSDLNKRASFQANLFQYRTKKCLWRDEDTRKVCNGGFAYFRDKNIPDKMIKNYNELHSWVRQQKCAREKRGLKLRFRETSLIFDDEPSMSKYVDNSCGGWKGMDHYWDNFEPLICNLRRKSAYGQDKLNTKNCMFVHML